MVEFVIGGSTSFRFFIDATSLSVGEDGVVRYTLVARSPAGVSNISYEGIRCVSGIYKIFALGNDGRWSPRGGDWKPIGQLTAQRWHLVLRSQFFCPLRDTIQTAAEGLDALRQGVHPAVRNMVR
jgi:hypothetical protein